MGHCHRTVQSLNCSVTWPKRQSHNHCSSFRTFTFWRPKKTFPFKGDQRKLRINFGKADSSYWLRRPTVSEKHMPGAKNTREKRGASKPLGTILTSANFTPTESARYRLVILIDGYHFWDQILTGHYDHTLEAIWRNENHFIFRRQF